MIFISYAKEDVAHARDLAAQLQRMGVEHFLAEDHIPPGENLRTMITSKISICQEFWLLLSPHSQGKSWIWWEMGAASILEKRIVPILAGLTAEQVTDDALKGLRMGDIDSPDKIFVAYKERLEKRSKLYGRYSYEAYNGLIPKGTPIYRGTCTIEGTSPPEGTERCAGFEWLDFDGLRTHESEKPVNEKWQQKWAAVCPDGRIRIEYKFAKPRPQLPSFASFWFVVEEQMLKGKYMIMGGRKPQQGIVWYTKQS
jgi:hypothetical protein